MQNDFNQLSDEQLADLDHAIMAETMKRNHLIGNPYADQLVKMDDESLYQLSAVIDNIIAEREVNRVAPEPYQEYNPHAEYPGGYME